MVTLEHSFLIDFTHMGVRGARETPIRLIVPVYTRAGARELPETVGGAIANRNVYTRAGARELPVEKKRDADARTAGLPGLAHS